MRISTSCPRALEHILQLQDVKRFIKHEHLVQHEHLREHGIVEEWQFDHLISSHHACRDFRLLDVEHNMTAKPTCGVTVSRSPKLHTMRQT